MLIFNRSPSLSLPRRTDEWCNSKEKRFLEKRSTQFQEKYRSLGRLVSRKLWALAVSRRSIEILECIKKRFQPRDFLHILRTYFNLTKSIKFFAFVFPLSLIRPINQAKIVRIVLWKRGRKRKKKEKTAGQCFKGRQKRRMRRARRRVTVRECLAHRAHKISAGRLPSSRDPPPAPPHPPSAALLVFTRNICTNRRFVTWPFFCPPSFRPPTAPTKRPFFSSHPSPTSPSSRFHYPRS